MELLACLVNWGWRSCSISAEAILFSGEGERRCCLSCCWNMLGHPRTSQLPEWGYFGFFCCLEKLANEEVCISHMGCIAPALSVNPLQFQFTSGMLARIRICLLHISTKQVRRFSKTTDFSRWFWQLHFVTPLSTTAVKPLHWGHKKMRITQHNMTHG